ncbi:pentapeptide repeat-containing protein [Halorussus caseinilyticus]|uniref:pentapeptide repeat-containing protein n=1 Tax=Halorussus caseinilyticus TaxID=3034025 RepID=UPI0023E80AF0|nr:pentapeptide repeat-containing protein [Halorussus sp. DT72]
MARTEERSAADATTTCQYTFDPARHTDARLQTTWECPHEAHGDSDYCRFHMSRDERASNDVTAEDIVARLKRNLESDDVRANEYVGANLPHLSLTYQDINGGTNHVLNFQYADIDGLDITHGRLEQGLNLRGATVGTLKFEGATIGGVLDGDQLSVEGTLSAYETTFREDVSFVGASFHGEVNCDETTFTDDTSFEGATFHDVAHFRNVETTGTSHVLDDHISFAGVEFRDDASFRQATFQYVTFEDTTFHAASDFEHVEFEGDTRFGGVVFDRMADFDEARFHDDACFEDARFKALAEFRGVEFNGGSRTTNDDVTFEGARFEGEADFKLARFRFADFKDATFEGEFNLDRAVFDARADCHRIEISGLANLERSEFREGVTFDGSTFAGDVEAVEAQFYGDADFVGATFRSRVRFTEARFREDASFREAAFHDAAIFRGVVFEGEAKHLEENASFDEVTFEATADFEAASFTNGSFRDVTFHDEGNFRTAEFHKGVEFRIVAGGSGDTYVDLTEATLCGGSVVITADSVVLYDLTKATLGDLNLESEGNQHQLLDHFRFCLTDFDHFDFSNHHAYLERNDWNVHDFLGDESSGRYDVEMTNEVIEETYRKAQDSANAVGDTPAMREFEFKRYFYNRKKNVDIVLHEYSLDVWGRLRKGASVGLNFFMQFTCGYGNRLPRIAVLTFLLPALFGVLYVLGGPLQTQAGVIWDAAQPSTTLFEGLYYSYISFSTIGYGDIGPVGWAAKILAASQGMLNGLFFTLLTFTLFKRVLGGKVPGGFSAVVGDFWSPANCLFLRARETSNPARADATACVSRPTARGMTE